MKRPRRQTTVKNERKIQGGRGPSRRESDGSGGPTVRKSRQTGDSGLSVSCHGRTDGDILVYIYHSRVKYSSVTTISSNQTTSTRPLKHALGCDAFGTEPTELSTGVLESMATSTTAVSTSSAIRERLRATCIPSSGRTTSSDLLLLMPAWV